MGFVGTFVLAAVAMAAVPGAQDGTKAISPVVAPTASAVRPAAAPADAAAVARKQMRAITDGVARIRRLMPLAENRAVRVTCVMQHLVEAKIHVQLADNEMAAFDAVPPDADKAEGAKPTAATAELARRTPGADADARAYALMRLDLIAKRTVELERAARVCVDDDLSSIDITEVKVEEDDGKPKPKK
jgi:hypothetical protein